MNADQLAKAVKAQNCVVLLAWAMLRDAGFPDWKADERFSDWLLQHDFRMAMPRKDAIGILVWPTSAA